MAIAFSHVGLWGFWSNLLSSLLLAGTVASPSPEFQSLHQALETHGFAVIFELPPQRGSYGLLAPQQQTIWINPVVFDLEIAEPTLTHEAVHAAQWCKVKGLGGDRIQPLGLSIRPPAITRPYFMRYDDLNRRQVEAEAYAIQAQPDGLEQAIALLDQHC